jgi:hypothetical protein
VNRVFTLYTDQLKRVIEKVEETAKNKPLASSAITLVISDGDDCLRLFQKVGHDWIYLDEETFCESK